MTYLELRNEIYHADKGSFTEQTFKSAIEDSNQTITFYGVVSHHKNPIVEIRIKTLTLEAITFLLHAKRYFPEARNKSYEYMH